MAATCPGVGVPLRGAPAINCGYAAQAIAQECIYSSGDKRSGQSCNDGDANGALGCIDRVNANNFDDECFSWCWGTGCANIQGSAGAGTAAIVGAVSAAGQALGVPGVGQIASLIANLINHGAAVHNTENTILCDVVPITAYILGSIVASFRAGNMSASQASYYMTQTLVQTRNALGSEAGRGSGQGLLRNIAVVNAYFDRELPDEENAMVAARQRAAVPGGVGAAGNAPTLGAVVGAPGRDSSLLWIAGAALAMFVLLL